MTIDGFSELATIILAISLASERMVTIFKTLFPKQLADEKKTSAQEVDLIRDRWRRVGVLLIAFLSSWFISSFLVSENWTLNSLFSTVPIGDNGTSAIPAFALGILSSGGSAFWNNILGYTKAVKDIKTQQKAKEGLEYHERADQLGVEAFDSGVTAKSRISTADSANYNESLTRIIDLPSPEFDLSQSRVL